MVIIRDSRETKDKLIEAFPKEYFLEHGDYLIMVSDKRLLVERKSISDAIHSFQQKRLDEQILHVDVLLVEMNYYAMKHFKGAAHNVQKHINRISLAMPVIRTESLNHTIEELYRLEEMLRNNEIGELRKPVIKNDLPPDVAKQALVLMGYPGIGAERAGRILSVFGSLEEALRDIGSWWKVEGISDKTCNRVLEFNRKLVQS
jgi:ERCC4-type nuclease